jgi:hypothetical protein
MKRERFDPIAQPAPLLSEAARADIEALRASDRLQRIFESDYRATHGAAARRESAGGRQRLNDAPEAGRRGLFSSRRARVLVGLVPLYAGVAVLAAEAVSALRDEPERAALVATVGQPDAAGPGQADRVGSGAAPAPQDDALSASAGRATAAPEIGADIAGTGQGGEPTKAPEAGRTAPAADRGLASVAASAVPEADAVAADRAETDGDRLALAPTADERVVIPPVKRQSAPATLSTPNIRAKQSSPGTAKASGDLAKAVERSAAAEPGAATADPGLTGVPEPSATATPEPRLALAPEAGVAGVPEPSAPVSGTPERSVSGAPEADVAAAPESGVAVAVPQAGSEAVLQDGTEAVPQATWSSQGASLLPVPAAAPRFARLSEVLAQDGGRRGVDVVKAVPQPQTTRRPASDLPPPRSQRQATAAPARREVAREAAREVPREASGSAPPRIVVHYRAQSGASTAQRVAAELRARGFARTELRPVSFGISAANVRYFHDQNRPAAREVNELLGSMWRRSDLRDFTHYSPLPSVGTVEVWLPG